MWSPGRAKEGRPIEHSNFDQWRGGGLISRFLTSRVIKLLHDQYQYGGLGACSVENLKSILHYLECLCSLVFLAKREGSVFKPDKSIGGIETIEREVGM